MNKCLNQAAKACPRSCFALLADNETLLNAFRVCRQYFTLLQKLLYVRK